MSGRRQLRRQTTELTTNHVGYDARVKTPAASGNGNIRHAIESCVVLIRSRRETIVICFAHVFASRPDEIVDRVVAAGARKGIVFAIARITLLVRMHVYCDCR